jgi:aryl-alcohol dehydrogenase-like predicted oxidoreductase
LHDFTLFDGFHAFCTRENIPVMSAAPLSMGLLTHSQVADWHPAGDELKDACRRAGKLAEGRGVNLASLAIKHALGVEDVPCTFLGMKNEGEVDTAVKAALECKKLTVEENEVLQELVKSREYFGELRKVPGWDWVKGVEEYRAERDGKN